MDFDLSEQQREIQATARDLLAARSGPAAVRAAAEARESDVALWREIAQLGWPGIAVEERYEGQGLGLVELCVVLEQAGAALAPIPLLVPCIFILLHIFVGFLQAFVFTLLPIIYVGGAVAEEH